MKRIFVLAAFFIFCSISLTAQITLNFQNLADMSSPRNAVTSAGDSNYFYVSNGASLTSPFTTETEKYDVATNSWSILTNSLIAKRFASSAIVGYNLYIFNGELSDGSYNNKVEVVSLSNGSVTFSTDNPAPARLAGASTWNGNIYAFGGTSSPNVYSNKLYKFDTSTQTWTQLTNMPEAKEAKGEIVDGKLYVIGGYHGTASNRIDIYDIQTDVWSTSLTTLPTAISAHSTTVIGNKVIVAFDYANETNLGYYDILSDTYTLMLQTNMIGRRHAGAQVARGNLYIMGGNSPSGSLSSLQFADLTATGIDELQNSNFTVYPNPTNNELFIEGLPKNSEIFIYDLTGKVVLHEKSIQHSIDVSHLKSGVYSTQIITRNSVTFAKPFVKQND